jgi:hypothetical protein
VIWNKNKILFLLFFNFFLTSALTNGHFQEKFFSLFSFHPLVHHLHCKYGAPTPAKHDEKINIFRPVSEQNFIPE